MFKSKLLPPPPPSRPPAAPLRSSQLKPRLAPLLRFLIAVSVALVLSVAVECYENIDELPRSHLRSHRWIKAAQNQDTIPSASIGSQGENQPLRLQLQRDTPHDRFEALQRAIHMDKIRAGRLVGKLNRRSALETNASVELTNLVISGATVGTGEYFVSLSVGTPPQNLYLIADTGSDLSWVKCTTPCTGECSSTEQSFVSSSSSSFQPVLCVSRQCASSFFPPACNPLSGACKFQCSYSDQSFASGDLARESMILGSGAGKNAKVDNVLIGCGMQYEGASFVKAGGVIGLGQGPLSLSSQLAAQNYTDMLSYCLNDFFGPSWSKGSLTFGQASYNEAMLYTPMLTNPLAGTYYYVGLTGVAVAGTALPIPADVWDLDLQGNGGTVVDSGTTLARFAEPAYSLIRAAFQQSIKYPLAEPVAGLDLCYNLTGISNVRFPQFSIALQGNLTLSPPQDNYFTQVTDGITCLAILGVPPASFSVLGNLMQQNYHVQFDKINNRVGFAPTNCSTLQA